MPKSLYIKKNKKGSAKVRTRPSDFFKKYDTVQDVQSKLGLTEKGAKKAMLRMRLRKNTTNPISGAKRNRGFEQSYYPREDERAANKIVPHKSDGEEGTHYASYGGKNTHPFMKETKEIKAYRKELQDEVKKRRMKYKRKRRESGNVP